MNARMYRGVTIERNTSGHYTAMVLLTGGPWGDYYKSLMADDLAGIEELIRRELR